MGLGKKLKNALSRDDSHNGRLKKETVPGSYPDETVSQLSQTDVGAYTSPRNAAIPPGFKEDTEAPDKPYRSSGNDVAYNTSGDGTLLGEHDQTKTKHGRKHAHHDSGIEVGADDRWEKDQYWNNEDREIGTNRHRGDADVMGFGESTVDGGRRWEDGSPKRTEIHDTKPSGPAVGGGVYNTVMGTGSAEDAKDIYGHQKGLTDNTESHESYDSTKYSPTKDVGVGTTGMRGTSTYQNSNTGGLPRSSLLEPDSTTSTSSTRQSSGTRASGLAAAPVASSLGRDHYGPAHEGAKVMHRCHNCGEDNDITHYFKKDAVYRIG